MLEDSILIGSGIVLVGVGALVGYAVCYRQHRDKIERMMLPQGGEPRGISFQDVRASYRAGQDDAAKQVMETVYGENKTDVVE